MKYNIQVTKVEKSRLPEIDFATIPFGKTFSDHMFIADYRDGEWQDARIIPFGNFEMHPAAMALHYGQAIFEGMKASVSHDGKPLFFRPEKHVTRINASATRLCMPTLPEELFLDAVHQLVGLDAAWIPPTEGSALYIRPYMFATDEFIGVKPSQTYKFVIFTGPVGPYYARPVSLIAETEYVRASQGGTGEAKCAGNYAASLLPAKKANDAGYDQVLWLDAKEYKYIQEVGTMNIFFVIDGKVVTPATDGNILRGITRESIIAILRDKGFDVTERPITIDEIVEAHQKGQLQEVFGTGTAAVVAKVNKIKYNDIVMNLPPITDDSVGQQAKKEINLLRSGKIEDKRGWIVPVGSYEVVGA